MRVALLSIILAVAAIALPVSAQALQDSYHLNIPRQPLDSALKDLAQQTGLQIARFSDTPGGSALVGPVSGDMSVGQALTSLLVNSGLTYKLVNDHTIAVLAPGAAFAPSASSSSSGTTQSSPTSLGDSQREGNKTSSDTFRVTQASPGLAASAATLGAPDEKSREKKSEVLEEVIVTAEKREERLLDVPVPVTAVNAESLVRENQFQLQDYYAQIPGLTYAGNGTEAAALAIRGLTTGSVNLNPTVAIVVDDVPYGSSTALGGAGLLVPDFDPSQLARVEVLRGPQGTLYGASSLGGLIKYVTVDPSTAGVSGEILAGTSTVYNGAELGYNVQGSINVPLSSTAAFTASAFTHQDPGYIDNPVLGLKGVNESHTSGGRLAALWRPSGDFSIKVSGLYEHLKWDGANHVELGTGLGDLQQNDIRGTGGFDRTLQAYSATIAAKLGSVALTSLTGYSNDRYHALVDYDYGLGALDGLTEPVFGIPNGTTQIAVPADSETSKFTQELRISVPVGPKIDWLFGGFYTHERSPQLQSVHAVDPSTGETLASWGDFSWYVTYTEYSAFTNLTVRFTDRFDVQFGGRGTHIDQSYKQTDSGPYVPIVEGFPSPLNYPEVVTHDNAFTYLVTPRFKVTPDLMLYLRLASGYRPGGPNPTAEPFGLPLSFKPDKTQNYEIGVKGDAFDQALTFDASLYYVDWKDIQISFIDPTNGFNYNANGSRAKSQGVEVSVGARPLRGLTVAAWLAFNDAVLTQPFPSGSAVYGNSGDRLPFSSRFSANLSMDEEFSLTSRATGFVGGTVTYVGDRVGNFTSPPPAVPPRQDYPAYARTDLRAGMRVDAWTAHVFATNVTDKRGLIYGGLGTIPSPYMFTYIQPRTVGLSISRTF